MNLKNKLQSHMRGWLPCEPTLATQHKPLQHVPYMVWWLAAGIAGGAGATYLLVLFGNITGITIESAAAFLWYIEVAFFAWCVGCFIAIYGYLRHKKAKGEQKHESS